MTRVVDFSSGKERLAPKRAAAKAEALKNRLAGARQDAAGGNLAKRRTTATKALTGIFKSSPKPGK